MRLLFVTIFLTFTYAAVWLPLSFLFIFCAYYKFTWESVLSLFLYLQCWLLILMCGGRSIRLNESRSILSQFNGDHAPYFITELHCWDYIDKTFELKLRGIAVNKPIEETLKVYTIHRKPNAPVPNQFSAHCMPGGNLVLCFVRLEEEDLKKESLNRYYLLHEIGHLATWTENLTNRLHVNIIWTIFNAAFAIWILGRFTSLITIIICGYAIFRVIFYMVISPILIEVYADQFAFSNLGESFNRIKEDIELYLKTMIESDQNRSVPRFKRFLRIWNSYTRLYCFHRQVLKFKSTNVIQRATPRRLFWQFDAIVIFILFIISPYPEHPSSIISIIALITFQFFCGIYCGINDSERYWNKLKEVCDL